MDKFVVGDIVKLISSEYTDHPYNPLWGGEYGFVKGRVTRLRDDRLHRYCVQWDNGQDNVYTRYDLEKLNTLPENLFEL